MPARFGGTHFTRAAQLVAHRGSFGLRIHMTTLSKTIVLHRIRRLGYRQRKHQKCSPFRHFPSLSSTTRTQRPELGGLRQPHAACRAQGTVVREIISRPKMSPRLILLLVGQANGAFCRLFGGSWGAVATVILATLLGMFIRQQMQKRHYNHFIVFHGIGFLRLHVRLSDPHSRMDARHRHRYERPVPHTGRPAHQRHHRHPRRRHTVTGTSRLIQATLLVICIGDRARSAPAVIHEEPAMITDIITDGLLAAIAAVGFGPSPTRPGKHSKYIAILAAAGHALRYTLMNYAGMDIASSSFCASLAIGLLALWFRTPVALSADSALPFRPCCP